MTGPHLSVAVGPGRPVPAGATAHEAVLRQAARSPRATALRGPGGTRLTYAELAGRARAVRDLLVDAGVPPRGFVPVAATAGGEFAVAALGVLLAGAAYAAVDPAWPARRLHGVFEDLGARVVLDATGDAAAVPAGRFPAGVRILRLPESNRPAPHGAGERADVGADDPACVFFTSGSTGRPKGVIVPHRAFVRTFVDGGYAAFGPGTVMPLLAAPYWDAGALEVFGPLMNGGTCVTPDEPLLTPDGLRALVAGHGVDTLWLTSSLVNLIVDEDPGAFTGVRHLMCGGERLSPAHIAVLLERHPGLRVTNGYGPVESMVFVSTHDVRPADTAAPYGIPVGRPVRGTVLAVLDPGTRRPVAPGAEGELWVAGDGLALGYVNRPEENTRRFSRVSLPGHGTLRAYATGDRVRMDDAGRLNFVGRADRQFKIRGYRVEPGEVERRVAGFPGVRQAFLVPLRDEHATVTGTVCAYASEDAAPLPEAALRRAAADHLPAHLHPDRYLHLHPVPLGPTGKADLRAVEGWVRQRVAEAAGGRAPVGGSAAVPDSASAGGSAPAAAPVAAVVSGPVPVSPALHQTRDILSAPHLEPDADLLDVGASSLHVLRIAARLSRLFGVSLSARDVYEHPRVSELEVLAARRRGGGHGGDGGTGDGGTGDGGTASFELSPGERRFWLASRLAPGAPGHVAVSRIAVSGTLDPERLGRALTAVVGAHPALRTTFPRQAGRPHRRVAGRPVPPELLIRTETEAAAGEHTVTQELAALVQDVEHGPLLAAAVLAAGPGRQLLLLAVHHIVYDARSEEILVADLAAAYAGRTPPAAPAPPAGLPRPGAAEAQEFWRGRLAGLTAPEWPGGAALGPRELWTRPLVTHRFALGAETTARLREFAARDRQPVLVPLLAAWWRALAEVTGQRDLAVGTIVEDRADAHERTVGYFANGLPVRIAADPALDATALLALVRDRLLEVFAHTALGTDEIAALAPRPPGGRAPLYQTLLVLQRPSAPAESDGLRFAPLAAPALGPQAELACELWDEGPSVTGAVTAPEGLLDPAVLAGITDLFTTALADLTRSRRPAVPRTPVASARPNPRVPEDHT
ncbi:amino acid adenylation domain-containing protein [Streptomyces camelliae]|uniref:Amino acid adenylation domain-containing protein n=1 Tax=Streptomyces camelliae TaxID=3004093 RepID=A0ABY7P396_9ACTN|nr:amino acid adenylation domain-containing protein [Streptomyces sp. HUAS 2-6]WBO64882.1 amino acid adenylation domain-containing protein [Streptomyces sp. HUAS 2-6]